MSFAPTAFRKLARQGGGWTAFRGLQSPPSAFRGQVGTVVYRSAGSTARVAFVGVSRNSAGVALGGCTMTLLRRTPAGIVLPVMTTVSDATGTYRFDDPGTGPFQIRLTKAGTPFVAGLSADTLQPAPYGASDAPPPYALGMADFQVRNLTGGTYGPTNGFESMYSTLPAAWQLTGQPNGADGVFAAWSGGAGDAAGKRLFVHGGGHSDSSNNGLYVYDFSGTTRPTGWTIAPNSLTATPPTQTTNEPTNGVYGDGKPAAIHTYDQLHYAPVLNRFYRCSGSAFSQTGNASAYSFYYEFTDSAWYALSSTDIATLGGTLIGAPDGSKVAILKGGVLSGSTAAVITSAGATTAVAHGMWSNDQELGLTSAYDSVNGRWLTLGYSVVPGQVAYTFTVDWATNTIANQTSRSISFPTEIEGASIVFDANYSGGPCFWIFGHATATNGNTDMQMVIYRVDASTFALTTHTLTGDSIALASTVVKGSFNRHVWFQSWRIIGTVHGHNAPMSIIKLPA